MSKKHPIDEYFKKGVSEHSTKPSAAVWDKIEAANNGGNSKKAGWYLLRVAVLTLFMSLSSLTFFNTSGLDELKFDENTVLRTGPETKKKKEVKPASKTEKGKTQNKEVKPKTKTTKKQVPILRQQLPNKMPILVNNDGAAVSKEVPVVDENKLAEQEGDNDIATADVVLENVPDDFVVRLKFKLKNPNTVRAFEQAQPEEEKKAFKEKLYAYANSQINNVRSGKPLELPKTGKPRIEISPKKLFNN